MFKHVLCPIDGSEPSLEALDMAAKLAAEQQAQLTIFAAVDVSRASAMAFGDPMMTAACLDALDSEAQIMLSDAAARVQSTIVAQTAAERNLPVDAILQYASEHGCDIIVMGSHGRTGIQRALIGSVAEGVVRHAPVPVLIDRFVKKPATVQA